MNSRKRFSFELKKIESCTAQAVSILDSRIGVIQTGRQLRALAVMTKTIAHSMSLQTICQQSLGKTDGIDFLDHFSIGALARCIIDSTLMMMYISEPSLTVAQWDLRRQVLFLHDLSNRKRFLKSMQRMVGEDGRKVPFFSEYPSNRENIVAKITARCEELSYTEEKTQDLIKGQAVFIDGGRGAVREAGISLDSYDFFQAYLSNHVHSHPVSLLRMEQHEISFEKPSKFQLEFSVLCLQECRKYLLMSWKRIEIFTGDVTKDPVGQLD